MSQTNLTGFNICGFQARKKTGFSKNIRIMIYLIPSNKIKCSSTVHAIPRVDRMSLNNLCRP
jgi:hypothetical protein